MKKKSLDIVRAIGFIHGGNTKHQTISENLSKIIEELTEIENKRKDEFSQEDKGVKAETRVSFEL